MALCRRFPRHLPSLSLPFYREKTQGLTVYRSLFNMVEGQVPHEEQDSKLSGLQRDRFHYHYERSCPSAEGQVPLSL